MIDELSRADEEIREIAPAIVSRHRSGGLLTWVLLHEIESEVLDLLTAHGNYSKQVLNMLRAPKVMGYPTDNRQVSFEGHSAVSPIFSAVEKTWNKVHQGREIRRSISIACAPSTYLSASHVEYVLLPR